MRSPKKKDIKELCAQDTDAPTSSCSDGVNH